MKFILNTAQSRKQQKKINPLISEAGLQEKEERTGILHAAPQEFPRKGGGGVGRPSKVKGQQLGPNPVVYV